MDANLKPSGIDGLGELSWGTHFCLFYETREDLLDFFIPFFKTGLEQNIFCLCVASQPLIAEEAERAMREAIPDFERYLIEGQVEISPHSDWYLKDGHFDEERVLKGWIDKLDKALAKGFSGVRFAANFLLDKPDWESFVRFEAKLDDRLHDLRIKGLCAYDLNRCSATNMLDVIRHHQFTLARREGTWEPLEGAQLKRAHEEVLKLNNELEQRVVERTAEFAAANAQLRREITERKQAEVKLRQNKEILQTVFDNVPAMITMVDKDGRFILTNRDFESRLGWRPGEMSEQNLDMLAELYPDSQDREAMLDFAERADGRWEDFLTRAKDGRMIDTSWAIVRLSDGSIIGVGKDNTERKRAEEALLKSERVLREAEALGHTGSWEQDLVTGEIFNTEENLRLFFGDDRSKGANLEDYAQVVHPDDRAYVLQRRAELLEEEGPGDIEYRVVWSDGSIHWIFGRATVVRDELDQVIRVYGTNVDITERKRAEEALRESEKLLQLVLATLPVGVVVTDPAGNIILTNPALRRIWGDVIISGSERWARSIGFWHDSGKKIAPQEWASLRALSKGETSLNELIDIETFDGALKTIQNSSAPIQSSKGVIVGAVIVNEDVTERKRAEEALRTSERVLREAESLGQTGSWEQDLVTGETFNSEANLRLFFGDDRSKGASFEDFVQAMHPDDREYVLQRRAQLIAEGQPGDTEFRVVWPDGRIHLIHRRATVVHDESGKAIRLYGTNVDITERKRAEEETKHQAARAETLARIAARLNKQLDLEAVIRAVCQEAVDTFKVSQAVISLYDKKRDLLDYAGGVNIPPQYGAKIESVSRAQFEEFVRTMGPILVVPDIQALPNVPSAEFTFELNVRTVVTADMQRDQELIGVLVLGVNGQVREFDPDELTLLKAISDQAAQAIANAQLLKTANEQREELRNLSTRLVQVQEAERRAITTELHDRVGQNLTGLSIAIQNMKASLSNQSQETVAAEINDAQTLLEDTTRHIRDIMAELYLPELEDHGLAAALETYADRVASRANLDLVVDLPETPLRLSSDVRVALFRAAQEAISNVLKHADATQLEISLQRENGRVRLRVEDNGQGFEPSPESPKETPSWGLKIMRERIESIGGKVQIESKLGEGTRVTFEIERFS